MPRHPSIQNPVCFTPLSNRGCTQTHMPTDCALVNWRINVRLLGALTVAGRWPSLLPRLTNGHHSPFLLPSKSLSLGRTSRPANGDHIETCLALSRPLVDYFLNRSINGFVVANKAKPVAIASQSISLRIYSLN